jgi:hypothetical protein
VVRMPDRATGCWACSGTHSGDLARAGAPLGTDHHADLHLPAPVSGTTGPFDMRVLVYITCEKENANIGLENLRLRRLRR